MASIIHNLLIQNNPEHIFTAIATEQGVQKWWTVQTSIRSEIGGAAEFRFGEQYHMVMEITELIPDHKVGWKCLKGDKEWIGTEIIYNLEVKEEGTLLRFSHSKWESQTEFFGHCNFQWGNYLMSLKKYCETGLGHPFKLQS